MARRLVVSQRLLAASLLACLVHPPDSQAQQASDSLVLVGLETVWNEAHTRGDANTLDRLWAQDLVVIVPGMRAMSKAEVLAVARSGRMRFLRYETSGVDVRVHGGAAVVTGRLHRAREIDGQLVTDDWQFTKVYVRRDGAWQVVAFHASATAP